MSPTIPPPPDPPCGDRPRPPAPDPTLIAALAHLDPAPIAPGSADGDLPAILARLDGMATRLGSGEAALEEGPPSVVSVTDLRDDRPTASLPHDRLMAGAPRSRDGHFHLPAARGGPSGSRVARAADDGSGD